MSNMTDLWVCEWSHKQRSLHVQPALDACKKNMAAWAENRACDYITLAIGTQAEVEAVADAARRALMRREDDRTSWRLLGDPRERA